MIRLSRTLTFLLLAALATTAAAKEVTIRRADLPPAVASTIDRRYPGAQILHLRRDTGAGGIRYEAEMRLKGQRVDALIGPRGKWLEEESEIRFSETPAAVRKSFEWHSRRGYTVERVERIMAAERRAAHYEILAKSASGYREVVFDGAGKLVRSTRVAPPD